MKDLTNKQLEFLIWLRDKDSMSASVLFDILSENVREEIDSAISNGQYDIHFIIVIHDVIARNKKVIKKEWSNR